MNLIGKHMECFSVNYKLLSGKFWLTWPWTALPFDLRGPCATSKYNPITNIFCIYFCFDEWHEMKGWELTISNLHTFFLCLSMIDPMNTWLKLHKYGLRLSSKIHHEISLEVIFFLSITLIAIAKYHLLFVPNFFMHKTYFTSGAELKLSQRHIRWRNKTNF